MVIIVLSEGLFTPKVKLFITVIYGIRSYLMRLLWYFFFSLFVSFQLQAFIVICNSIDEQIDEFYVG